MNDIFKKFLIFSLSVFLTENVWAQKDSLRFSDGQLMAGEIKSMKEGILEVETDFSDSDFKIEWKDVVWMKTETKFFITIKNEETYYSSIKSLNDSLVQIVTKKNDSLYFDLHKIVYLDALKEKFKDRFNAEVSVGFDLAKSRNLRSLSLRSLMGYKTDIWSTDLNYNALASSQDDSDLIKRLESEFNFRWILIKQWYIIGTVSTLSSTEQNIELRLNSQLGIGRYIFRTNKAHWGAKLGGNYNIENYSNQSFDKNSWEVFLGTELNLYDIDDLNLKFSAMVYSGITEPGRWRGDINFDIKYDLPLDFFIKIGASLNYDNQPALNSDEADYVIQSTFGWEW